MTCRFRFGFDVWSAAFSHVFVLVGRLQLRLSWLVGQSIPGVAGLHCGRDRLSVHWQTS